MKTWQDIGIDLPDSFEGEKTALCPQCSPSRKKSKVKCLSANGDNGIWICHHCDYRGSLKEGTYDKGNQNVYSKPKIYLKPKFNETKLDSKVIAYFAKRGISGRVLKLNKIGYGKIYFPQLQDYATAIQFPYYRDGEVINIKYRDGKKNFRMATGAERILYNKNNIIPNCSELIWVEGEVDVLSLQEAGIINCVSVPDGAPSPKAKNYDTKFLFLETIEDFLCPIKTHILAVDNDEPGKKLEEELARRLGKEKCKRVTWPEGCKDANEVLVQHGKEKLLECIKKAKDYPIEGLFELNDFREDFFHLYAHGFVKGESTGWLNIDELYTIRLGELTLIGGIPGMGKSAWLNALMVNLSKCGWITGFYSPEQRPLHRHAASLAEILSGQPFDIGKQNRITEEMLKEYYTDYINHYFKFILPNNETQHTLDAILDLAKSAVLKFGLKGLCIDPWNALEHKRPNGTAETEYISESLTKLVNFAQCRGVHIWLVVHPPSMRNNKDSAGKYRVPTAYDLSGSAHWFNKAFNIITIHREKRGQDDDDHKAQIHVQKIKFKEVGRLGVKELSFDRNSGRYSEVPF